MTDSNQSAKRLKLEIETLRHLKSVELARVVGGIAGAGYAVSLSKGCNCETDSYDCTIQQ